MSSKMKGMEELATSFIRQIDFCSEQTEEALHQLIK